MCKIILSVLILCLSIHHAIQYEIAETDINKPDFDVFVFTHHWPVSVCKWWVYELNGTDCGFPDDKTRWTVHGIWPRKYGANYTYCNTSWAFDPEVLAPIKDELDQAWTHIYTEEDPYKFWEHEWLKHGTCALDIKPFNSQFKYFSKGIEWNKKYSLSDMLGAANLFPDDKKEFTPEQFTDAVKAKTKKIPMIGCYTIDDVLYLHELRICIDKQLNVVDCGPPIDRYVSSPLLWKSELSRYKTGDL